MLLRSNKKNYLFLCLCLFVDYRKKKKKKKKKKERKYKELELTKLEFHITRNSSMGSSSTIEENKKRAIRSSFVFTKNSSLISSSILLHGTQV